MPRSIAESHFQIARTHAALGKMIDCETSIKAAILVLEERASNLSKMEISPHLIDEIADLEELGISLEETLAEFKVFCWKFIHVTLKFHISGGKPESL